MVKKVNKQRPSFQEQLDVLSAQVGGFNAKFDMILAKLSSGT